MSRNMTSYYSTLSDKDLRRLEGKKILRGMKISKDGSWFALKEKATLRQQILWIRAELRCRTEQQKLLL
jgi:hypothetical protein